MRNSSVGRLGLSLLAMTAVAFSTVPVHGQAVQLQQVRKGQAIIVMPSACERGGVEAGLIAVAAGFASKFLVGWVKEKLEARKAGLTGQFVAGGVVDKDPVGTSCLRLYRGPIGTAGIPTDNTAAQSADFLLDADVVVSGTVWKLVPARLVYRNSSAKTKTPTKHVSVVIALTESRPADATKIDAEKPLAVFRHDFGELKLSSEYRGGTLTGTASAASVGKHSALNVTAIVTESAEPGPAMTALLGAFSESEDALTATLTETIKKALGGKE